MSSRMRLEIIGGDGSFCTSSLTLDSILGVMCQIVVRLASLVNVYELMPNPLLLTGVRAMVSAVSYLIEGVGGHLVRQKFRWIILQVLLHKTGLDHMLLRSDAGSTCYPHHKESLSFTMVGILTLRPTNSSVYAWKLSCSNTNAHSIMVLVEFAVNTFCHRAASPGDTARKISPSW